MASKILPSLFRTLLRFYYELMKIICLLFYVIKGTDRLCKVVKLSMQCCGQILYDSFETYKPFPRYIITEFERNVDVQNP